MELFKVLIIIATIYQEFVVKKSTAAAGTLLSTEHYFFNYGLAIYWP